MFGAVAATGGHWKLKGNSRGPHRPLLPPGGAQRKVNKGLTYEGDISFRRQVSRFLKRDLKTPSAGSLLTPKCPQQLGPGQAKIRSQDLPHLDLPHGQQGPKDLSPLSAAFQGMH